MQFCLDCTDNDAMRETMKQTSTSPNKIRVTCSKCRYNFKYDKEKRYPSLCPNCGISIEFR